MTLRVVVAALEPADPQTVKSLLAPASTPLPGPPPVGAATIDGVADLAAASPDGAPTVVVVDIGDGDPGDVRLDDLFRRTSVPVVVVSEVAETLPALTALRRGASGYLLHDVTGEELRAALDRVAAGQVVIDPTLAGRIVRRLADRTWQEPPPTDDQWDLRPRERQVLEALVAGRTNRQIASDLNLGEATVKTYLRTAYRKIGAHNRIQAVAIYRGRHL